MKARAILAIVLALLTVAAFAWLVRPAERAQPTTLADAGVEVLPNDAGLDAGVDSGVDAAAGTEALHAAPPEGPALEAPAGSSIALAISPEAPELVTVLAERTDFGSVYALVTLERRDARAAAPDQNEEVAEEEEAEAEEPCAGEEENDDAYCECMRDGAASVDAGWLAALGRPAFRHELVRLSHGDDTYRVVVRVALTEPVLVEDTEGVELRASDMDGDGRSEITVLFPFTVPDCDTFLEDGGTIGAIFDAGDLHLQAAFVREATSLSGDSDVNSDSIETVWRAVDEDGDGHADLRVRATTRTSSSDPPDFETPDSRAQEHEDSASAVCPYDITTDRWQCPEGALPVPTWFTSIAPSLSPSFP